MVSRMSISITASLHHRSVSSVGGCSGAFISCSSSAQRMNTKYAKSTKQKRASESANKDGQCEPLPGDSYKYKCFETVDEGENGFANDGPGPGDGHLHDCQQNFLRSLIECNEIRRKALVRNVAVLESGKVLQVPAKRMELENVYRVHDMIADPTEREHFVDLHQQVGEFQVEFQRKWTQLKMRACN